MVFNDKDFNKWDLENEIEELKYELVRVNKKD
jgi:hypothetical protein